MRRLSPYLYITALLTIGNTVLNARATVVINEIHYDPMNRAELVEFVELYNAGTNQVDLTGWYFSSGIS